VVTVNCSLYLLFLCLVLSALYFNVFSEIVTNLSIYRKAVASHSPGLPLRLPWVKRSSLFNRNAVATIVATRSGLVNQYSLTPGLK
jgi:hypothetical protein